MVKWQLTQLHTLLVLHIKGLKLYIKNLLSVVTTVDVAGLQGRCF